MSPDIDSDKISAIIAEAAETIILPRYRQLNDYDIHTKSGPNDLVTIADRESEIFLERRLLGLYPDSVFIGEESISEGRKSLDSLQQRDRLIWVADPVDGTHNFVNGKREFGVMLAAVLNDVTVHGWIYDVLGRSMLTAGLGQGAWRAGTKLKTAAAKPLNEIGAYVGLKYFRENLQPHLRANKDRVAKFSNLGCAAHEYIHLTEGSADCALYSRVKPWDHLAGALAVTEAGGVARLWDGRPYRASFSGHGILIASCAAVADEMQAVFIDPMLAGSPL